MSTSPYTYNAIVHRVIDGDTIVVNIDLGFDMWRMAQTIRVRGINAAEHTAPGGSEATAHLDELLPHGTPVVLTSTKADKYGNRYDAQLHLSDDSDLAATLISTQWAAAWDGHGERPVPPWPRTTA